MIQWPLWLSLGGCVQTVFFPPDLWAWESGFWDTGRGRNNNNNNNNNRGTLRVTEVESGCDLDGTSWVTEIRTNGWIADAKLLVFRLGDGAVEEHPFTLIDSAPNGDWDWLRVGPLQSSIPPEYVVPGASSQFSCSEDIDRLTWVSRIWDGSGQLLDCLVWGENPTGAIAQVRAIDPDINALGGCRQYDGTPPAP